MVMPSRSIGIPVGLEIVFASRKLGKQLCDSRTLQATHGRLADVIRQRLDDLRAVANLKDAAQLPGRLEPLTGNRAGTFSMRLSPNHRLIFEPANEPLPRLPDGGLDWSKITAIRIIEVKDYH